MISYKTTELYWRFPTYDESPSLEININDLSTVCCNKTFVASIRQVSIPELFIPPAFSADLFSEKTPEEEQSNWAEN